MKKKVLNYILIVTLIIVLVSGATYAFFRASTDAANYINSNTSQMNIVYTKGNEINGAIRMVSNRTEGYNTTINIHTTNNSVNPEISLFINIEELTQNLSITGLIWEVCAAREGDETQCRSGNFSGYNDTNNNIIYIYPNYALSTVNTQFTVYIWLDGANTNNSVVGGVFSGYIGAESENFTARFT